MHEVAVIAMQKQTDAVWLRLGHEPLQVGAAASFLAAPEAGGIDIFVGTTRQWTDGRETLRLEYECYEAMALKEMERIAAVARSRWPLARVCLHHRLGVVPIGEASVVVGVAAPHRNEAFQACRFLIDTLKKQVPIWKREVFADGGEEWVQGDTPEVPQRERRAETKP